MTYISMHNADALGFSVMLQQTQEECAELIRAISKIYRACGTGMPTETTVIEAYDNLVEEIADVEICLEQIKYLMDISTESVKAYKLQRTADMINTV